MPTSRYSDEVLAFAQRHGEASSQRLTARDLLGRQADRSTFAQDDPLHKSNSVRDGSHQEYMPKAVEEASRPSSALGAHDVARSQCWEGRVHERQSRGRKQTKREREGTEEG